MTSIAPLIFRIASWPMAATETLRSQTFTARVDDALTKEEAVRARSAELSDLLYAEVPRLSREQRRVALRVRRDLHRSAEPVSDADLASLLACPELSEAARALLQTDDAERRSLRCLFEWLRDSYSSALEVEQAALDHIAAEPDFRTALAVASPGTSDAWEQALREGGRSEGWRLRATLLNYVLRAAGRATPNGLWAGVAMEVPWDGAEPISVRRADAKVFVKPDVNVFFDLFAAATSAGHYRRTAYLRLNPTLTEIAPGDYVYAHSREGSWMILRTADDGSIAQVRASLRSADMVDFDELLVRTGLTDDVLHGLYVAGVLGPECDREGIYENAAAALQALLACLKPTERQRWEEAIGELWRICSTLQGCPGDLSVDGLRTELRRARRIVNDLGKHYDAKAYPEDRNVLIFDLTAPFEIGVSDAVREQISGVVRRYWDFDRGGMGELLARSARRSMAGDDAADGVLALAGMSIERTDAATQESDGEIEARRADLLQKWTDDLEASAKSSTHRVGLAWPEVSPMGPGAALIVPGITPDGMAVRVGSVAPDWGAFYGRFHHLFAASARLEFWHWLERSKAEVEANGFVLADVAVRGAHDRNAALRPRLGDTILDPLRQKTTGLTAECDAEHGAGLRDEQDRPVFPALHSAVETSDADPWSRWFTDVGRQAGRTSLLYPQPPLEGELTEWKHSPRLLLDTNTVIAPERWWCPAETLEQLRKRTGFDRFAAWRSWIRRAGVPERTYAQYGAVGTETLLPTDSLLAVEVLGRSLSQTDAPLRLQEMFFGKNGLWLKDEQGRGYMAEMALAWAGDREFWTV